ncbi:24-hydroxycholesterol 7-alpha-hydroxylase-like [Gigantopelta aegis]|uniref:24-hydroxycholesterol 7-alpha-hydroxylase-like n=1 Tax=Gigantopelta aegis TaxID=1735272 RepID=UPI001B88A5E8|nr:24-hydroxycholesterol 7-alpha-hydroxylase-like [Gigantopelta aegis]
MELGTEVVWALTVFLIVVFTLLIKRKKHTNYPPLYSGWIPWLGCALEFGRAPVLFIEAKRKELGSIFSLYITGERYTFFTDPEDYGHFFYSSNVSFGQAVQNSVQRVASITEESFFKYHTSLHDAVKGRLAASQLASISPSLLHNFKQHLDHVTTGDCESLHAVIQTVMYKSVMTELFGKGILPTESETEYAEFEKHFIKFDDQFEYGSRLPPFFLKDWSTSKQWLLKLFTGVVKRLEKCQDNGDKQTLQQHLIGLVDRRHAPNYSMLLLWASLANAIPITFWTLAFMMNNKDVMKKARSEVDTVLGKSTHITEEVLREMPYLKMCILESIRMRSPGVVVRKVVKGFTVKGYKIPEGDIVMVSPYWTHRNPKYFHDPNTFNPERWNKEDLDKNLFPPGFIGFGGGRYQCPGRWFALLEMHMFVALFLQRFDCKLLSPVPQPSTLHVVGTQQPMGRCDFQLSNRLV